jgi:arsenate reductase-like glutaredoxin family protein
MDVHDIQPREVVPASRKLARDEAVRLARQAKKIVVARGATVTEFDGGAKATDEAIEAMLGPTGNLRAPTVRVGTTLLVGFDERSYREALT